MPSAFPGPTLWARLGISLTMTAAVPGRACRTASRVEQISVPLARVRSGPAGSLQGMRTEAEPAASLAGVATQAGGPGSQETCAHTHRKEGHLAGERGWLSVARKRRKGS